ncbi:prolyl oligopeptidase family serine peptidase [Piscinibacter sp.]|uniref:prolyl oligopeptidase family serine peptidase n=1 Tax=Piscinibacter sp. TaxID=1903157 RepID=UPI002C826480|nr:prolyl oligopeptidase family serine peptidase [Albitalea sp.]HUG25992.1 prolyl oligopeptidase family serine peptidase [Albitalea sp.]
MNPSSLRRAATALALLATVTAGFSQTSLPKAEPRNVPETFFGTTVDDPYRHFEDTKAPDVAAWMKAHSEHAHATLRRIAGRDALRAKIEQFDASAPARVTGVERTRGERYFYQRRGAKEDQFKLYMRQGLGGDEKLLFDPETLKASTGKPHAINYFSPSPDGKLVAIGVSAAGSEDASLRILDTASGRQIGPEISRAQFAGPSWTPDGGELFFSRLQELKPGMPGTDKYQRSTVVAMKPGDDEKALRTVMRAGADLGIPATEFPYFDVQPDGRVVAYVSDGVSPDFRALHTTLAQLRAGKPEWKPLVEREDRVTALALHGDQVYALSFRDAPRYKLLAGKLDDFSTAKARVLVPESQRVLTGIAAVADALYVEQRDGNVKRLFKLAYTGAASPKEVALPVAGAFKFAGLRPELPGVMLDLQGWTRSRQIYTVAPNGKVSDSGLQPIGPFDAPTDIVAGEVIVKSHDGAMVPMSIIHKKGVKLDGNNPVLLYGYASYGITEEPWFSYSRLAWMEAGGVFAVANPRGSGVFGRQWHEAGRQATKPNTWKDFIACAEYLIEKKWTQPSRLGIWGGSAGGILVGRAMTERPKLFAAVVPSVGALDMLRMETTPNGVPNIPEFGTRTNEAGFRSLLAMSTYHQVKDGTKYPAVLLTHGVNDPRVEVWHTTKAGARLIAASTSGKPVLLRLNYDAGHGVGNTKSQTFDEVADVYAFMLWQMGVKGYELKQP